MENKFYCNLKWDMAGINLSDQSIAQCCRSSWVPFDLNASKKDVIQIFNSAEVIVDRQETLEGKVPSSCSNCVNYEQQGVSIQNYLLDSRDDAKVYTSGNKTTLPPRVDFVLHNFCNLTCVYCGPIFSSSWTKEIQKNGPYQSMTISPKDIVKNKIPLSDYSNSTSFSVIKNIINHSDFKSVDTITLLGGEPLINPYLLDVVVDILTHNSTVKLWITTGLGVPDKTFYSTIAKLKSIDKNNQIGINVSAESTGSFFEFIRHGLTWSEFDTRLKHLVSVFGTEKLSMMTVFFILSIFDYKNFLLYIKSLGLDPTKVQFGYLEDPEFLSLLQFNNSVTDCYINELLSSDLLSERARVTLESTKKLQKMNQKSNKDFITYINEFAKRRNLDLSIFPKELFNETI